jgi:large subunit ribosomal protein L11
VEGYPGLYIKVHFPEPYHKPLVIKRRRKMAKQKKKKKVAGKINLTITGGSANPSPPVGPALGQHGVNIMEFCKAFNEDTEDRKGIPIPVIITVYEDRSFSFITKTPPASYYIKKAANIDKGSSTPGLSSAGTIKLRQVKEIAEAKMPDLNASDIESAIKIIEGSARSMGIEVEEG